MLGPHWVKSEAISIIMVVFKNKACIGANFISSPSIFKGSHILCGYVPIYSKESIF